jgi:hypothetical protein
MELSDGVRASNASSSQYQLKPQAGGVFREIRWHDHQEPRSLRDRGFRIDPGQNDALKDALQNQADDRDCGQTAREMEDVMASWRDDKARATLIHEASGSVQPGKTPRSFAEHLFGHANLEDLANYDAASLAFLAEQAWEHVRSNERRAVPTSASSIR